MREAKRRLIDRLLREISDERVIDAMRRVPREEFVPADCKHLAYDDIPLPIGEGQTISQPYMVAIMVQALEPRQTDRLLEVGTGSGYQAAVLAGLAARVISVERVASLIEPARLRLCSLGYANVEVVVAEDSLGLIREAPFDGIIVAAGAPKLPRDLMRQLADGGRMVIPVGSRESQELMKVSRSADTYVVQTLGACRFVPLIGEGAWPDAGMEG